MNDPGFETFYRTSRDRCFRALIVAVADPGEAEDLLAEAYTRALERWPTVRSHPAPEAWVIRVAMNLQRDRWRRARRAITSVLGSGAADPLYLAKALRQRDPKFGGAILQPDQGWAPRSYWNVIGRVEGRRGRHAAARDELIYRRQSAAFHLADS